MNFIRFKMPHAIAFIGSLVLIVIIISIAVIVITDSLAQSEVYIMELFGFAISFAGWEVWYFS